jgi:hypothetical protein
VQTLHVLFINIHHLINEYRPHQARETIRAMLLKQIRHSEIVAAEVKRYELCQGIILRPFETNKTFDVLYDYLNKSLQHGYVQELKARRRAIWQGVWASFCLHKFVCMCQYMYACIYVFM